MPSRHAAAGGQDEITAQINHTQTAIDRHHTAFENGTMDDATAGPRITELRNKITQLAARRDDLSVGLDNEPAPPPPGTIDRLRAYLHRAITVGTSGERNAPSKLWWPKSASPRKAR